jgi:hypothetical protein
MNRVERVKTEYQKLNQQARQLNSVKFNNYPDSQFIMIYYLAFNPFE